MLLTGLPRIMNRFECKSTSGQDSRINSYCPPETLGQIANLSGRNNLSRFAIVEAVGRPVRVT